MSPAGNAGRVHPTSFEMIITTNQSLPVHVHCTIGVSSGKKHEVYVVSAKVLDTRGTGDGVTSTSCFLTDGTPMMALTTTVSSNSSDLIQSNSVIREIACPHPAHTVGRVLTNTRKS